MPPTNKKLLLSVIIISLFFSCSKNPELLAKLKARFGYKYFPVSQPQSNLIGTWFGYYIDSSDFDKTLMRVQMIVTIVNGKFNGIVTARDDASYPTYILIGTFNSDTTQLTLQPIGTIPFENPWRISGNTISGAIHSNLPEVTRYEFTKQ